MLRRPTSVLGLLLAVTVVLAGCGDDAEGDQPRGDRFPTEEAPDPTGSAPVTPSAPTPDLPDCADVWVEGERLPARYAGCLDERGQVSHDVRTCSIGDQLATHDDRWYAVPGRVVNRARPDLDGDPAYAAAVLACTG